MKKIIIGIFAHPDDEAFGPSATLVMEKAAGNQVHLICATAGESGMNPDEHERLAHIRLEEWHQAGSLIGADSMHQLGYRDGYLSNHNFHEAADKVTAIIDGILKSATADTDIELMSIDLNGVTGHLDHIFIGRVACYVFCNYKKTDQRFSRIRLACLPRAHAPQPNCDWLYMEAGRTAAEIGEVVDAREHVETVYKIMRAHQTQRLDGEAHIRRLGDQVAVNHFMIVG